MMTRKSLIIRLAIITAFGAAAAILLSDVALAPFYVRGTGQGVISHFNSFSGLLATPGYFIVSALGMWQGHHITTEAWVGMLVASLVFYFVASLFTFHLWRTVADAWQGRGAKRKLAVDSSDSERVPGASPFRVSRRRAMAAGAGVLAAGAIGYPIGIETRRYEITHRRFPVRNLPVGFDGLRIAQLTDVHHGPWIPLSHVRDIVKSTNALQPDLIFLTGDYVHRSAEFIEPVVEALAGLKAKIGIVGVLGNHDWWEDGPRTQRAFMKAGIPLIDNARMVLTPSRELIRGSAGPASGGLCIAGVGDYYEDAQRYDDALGGLPDEMPRLLLSHNPDVAEDPNFLASRHRVDLILSGHTHGGQVYIPGLGTPIVPSRYGQKYASGLVQGPACPVFISRGLGHVILPLRVGVRPELAIIELARGSGA